MMLLGFSIDKFDGANVVEADKSPGYDVYKIFSFQRWQYRLKTAIGAEIWMILMGLENSS